MTKRITIDQLEQRFAATVRLAKEAGVFQSEGVEYLLAHGSASAGMPYGVLGRMTGQSARFTVGFPPLGETAREAFETLGVINATLNMVQVARREQQS